MIFTPCRDGISHNEAEHAEQDEAASGVNVLLHAVLAGANLSLPPARECSVIDASISR